MQDEPIIAMLREEGMTEDQITFLLKVLSRIRADRTNPKWDGAAAAVKSVLEHETNLQ